MSRLTLATAAFVIAAGGGAVGTAAQHQFMIGGSPYLASFVGACATAAVGWALIRRHLPDRDHGRS